MTIATFGDINIDVVLDVDDLPRRGGEVFSSRRRELLGGSAVNTAVVLRRLGLESAVMGAVGDDEAGHRALYRLGTIGVGTDLTSISQTHPTAMNTILVTPDRERTMVGARGANVHYTAAPGWHEGVGWLHVSGYALMEGAQQQSALAALTTAQQHDIACSLDVPVGVGRHVRHLVGEHLTALRIITGSRTGLAELTGGDDPVDELAGGSLLVAMTAGAGPLVLAGPEGKIGLTPPTVASVDMTGAGDAFAAGLIAGGVLGLDPGPAAVLAAAAGAAATLVPGASETLADETVMPYLLGTDRWSDADPAWLDEVRSKLGRPG